MLVRRYRENISNAWLLKISQFDKIPFWVLLIGSSYISQNSSVTSKYLAICLEKFTMQNRLAFIEIQKNSMEHLYYRFGRGSGAVTPIGNYRKSDELSESIIVF
jgi:hypothetical protein